MVVFPQFSGAWERYLLSTHLSSSWSKVLTYLGRTELYFWRKDYLIKQHSKYWTELYGGIQYSHFHLLNIQREVKSCWWREKLHDYVALGLFCACFSLLLSPHFSSSSHPCALVGGVEFFPCICCWTWETWVRGTCGFGFPFTSVHKNDFCLTWWGFSTERQIPGDCWNSFIC